MATLPDRPISGAVIPHDGHSDPVGPPFSKRLGQLVLIAALSVLGVWVVWDFLPALGWAVVVAIAVWPLFGRLVASGVNRSAGAAIFTLLLGLLLLVPLAVLAVEIGREAVTVIQWIRAAEQEGIAAPAWLARMPLIGAPLVEWWQSNLSEPRAPVQLLGRLDRSVVIEWTRLLGVQLVHRLTIFGFTLLTLFFLFRDGPSLLEQAATIIDRMFGTTGTRLSIQVLVSVRATLNGLVLVGLGEGLLLGIAYALCGLPHPVLLGALTALLAMVPFGAPLIYSVGALVLVGQSQTSAAIALFAFGSALVFVADHFVRPILIGGATRLPFLWILLGIFGGLETFGLLGLFLGPAVMASLMAVWREWSGEIAQPLPHAE